MLAGSILLLLSGGLRQLHEVDGLGVLGRPVVECLGREETGPLGKVVGIPEDVLVALGSGGADLGGGQALECPREQEAIAAARAGDVGEPRRRRVGEEVLHEDEGVGEGVYEARQAMGEVGGEQRPEGGVEAGGEQVHVLGARSQRLEGPRRRHATDEPRVDDGQLPGAHRVQLLYASVVSSGRIDQARGEEDRSCMIVAGCRTYRDGGRVV